MMFDIIEEAAAAAWVELTQFATDIGPDPVTKTSYMDMLHEKGMLSARDAHRICVEHYNRDRKPPHCIRTVDTDPTLVNGEVKFWDNNSPPEERAQKYLSLSLFLSISLYFSLFLSLSLSL
jgi:hypothetical protein